MATELQTRAFQLVDFQFRDEGRTVEGLIVPYGESATVYSEDGPYQEQFQPGSFRRDVVGAARVGNAHWVKLTLEHSDSLGNRLGYGQELREDTAGLVGIFHLYKTEAAKARDVIGETHKGLSVGFYPIHSSVGEDGETIIRTDCKLDHVAVTPIPAYEGAKVLSIREELEAMGLETPRLDEVKEYLDSLTTSR